MDNQKAIEILMDIQSDWEDGEEYESFDLAIEALEKQTSWISTEDKLPERNKHVLLCLKNDNETAQVVGYLFFTENKEFSKFNDEFSAYNGDALPDFLEKKYVLAWQPLPELYK